jgi:hypothetical protein
MASYDVASNICPALGLGASVFCTTLEEIAFSDEKSRRRRGRETGAERCRLTNSNPVLKEPMVSVLETIML